MEVAHGIHRIESSLGVRSMAQYTLVGSERRLLVDTGIANTPAETLAPYLASVGLTLESIDDVISSHADNDHMGGNRALTGSPSTRTLRLPRARSALDRVQRGAGGRELPLA